MEFAPTIGGIVRAWHDPWRAIGTRLRLSVMRGAAQHGGGRSSIPWTFPGHHARDEGGGSTGTRAPALGAPGAVTQARRLGSVVRRQTQ